jgi:hypothetical protein
LNPDCANYDPCYGRKTDASFGFGSLISDGLTTTIYYEDSVIEGAVYFYGKNNGGKSYTWSIAGDNRTFTGQQMTLNFTNFRDSSLYGRPIPVTMIETRTPDHSCFPLDDGADTVTRNLYVYAFKDAAYMGNWQLYKESEGPTHAYPVNMSYSPDTISGMVKTLTFRNLFNDGRVCYNNGGDTKMGYRSAYTKGYYEAWYNLFPNGAHGMNLQTQIVVNTAARTMRMKVMRQYTYANLSIPWPRDTFYMSGWKVN